MPRRARSTPRKPPPPPGAKLTIAIEGDGITPKDVSLRQLSELLAATAEAFDAIASDRNGPSPTVSLAKVKNGSAAYELVSDDRRARPVVRSFVATARQRGKNASVRTRKALGRLRQVAGKNGALRIEPEGPAKPIYLAAPAEVLSTEIEEGTVVRGRVVGVRIDVRDQGAVTLRYDDGGQGDFGSSLELTIRAAALIGKQVAARVTFLRGEEKDHAGEIEALEEKAPDSGFLDAIRKAREQLRAKGVVIDSAAWLADEDEQ